MIYVISKATFGSYNVRDIQCNANWDCCPYSDYALIPDSMVDGILATQGYCDITLNSTGTEVTGFTARTIPSVPDECCGTNTVLSVNGVKANTDGELTLTAAQVGARPNTWMPTAAEVGAFPATGGKLTGSLNVNDGVSMWKDNEGGNIEIYPPSGNTYTSAWHIDAFDGGLRIFANKKATNPNGEGLVFPLYLYTDGSISVGNKEKTRERLGAAAAGYTVDTSVSGLTLIKSNGIVHAYSHTGYILTDSIIPEGYRPINQVVFEGWFIDKQYNSYDTSVRIQTNGVMQENHSGQWSTDQWVRFQGSWQV